MKQEKRIKGISLNFVWKIRMNFYAESGKLRAEGDKLWAEGDKLWAEATIEVYGNISIMWKNYNEEKQSFECHLETGEIFKP